MNSEDMAGRIMAHAFNDELEKISARAPRRFLKGPNPFKEGTEEYYRVGYARLQKRRGKAVGSSRDRASNMQRLDIDRLPRQFLDDKAAARAGRRPRRPAYSGDVLADDRILKIRDRLAASDRRRGVTSSLLDKALKRKTFAFGKMREGTDLRAQLRKRLAEGPRKPLIGSKRGFFSDPVPAVKTPSASDTKARTSRIDPRAAFKI
jgi:uncharacterized protein YicC (UPF0701 family)